MLDSHLSSHGCELLADSVLRLVQLMIPEKSSVMPQLVPYEVSGPYALWRAVVAEMAAQEGRGGASLIDG